MGLSAAAREAEVIRMPNLVDTISELRQEFFRMKDELCEARREIRRLQGKLGRIQHLTEAMAAIDIDALRRKVACYCHPDRGGDGEVMSTINMVLDYLDSEERQPRRIGQRGKGERIS